MARIGHQEDGLDRPVHLPVHYGHLEFVVVVGDCTKAPNDHLRADLAREMNQEGLVGPDLDLGELGQGFGRELGHLNPLGQGKHRAFVDIDGHADHQLVDQLYGARQHVQMAIVDRVEGARIESYAQSAASPACEFRFAEGWGINRSVNRFAAFHRRRPHRRHRLVGGSASRRRLPAVRPRPRARPRRCGRWSPRRCCGRRCGSPRPGSGSTGPGPSPAGSHHSDRPGRRRPAARRAWKGRARSGPGRHVPCADSRRRRFVCHSLRWRRSGRIPRLRPVRRCVRPTG